MHRVRSQCLNTGRGCCLIKEINCKSFFEMVNDNRHFETVVTYISSIVSYGAYTLVASNDLQPKKAGKERDYFAFKCTASLCEAPHSLQYTGAPAVLMDTEDALYLAAEADGQSHFTTCHSNHVCACSLRLQLAWLSVVSLHRSCLLACRNSFLRSSFVFFLLLFFPERDPSCVTGLGSQRLLPDEEDGTYHTTHNHTLVIEPEELVFTNVRLNQVRLEAEGLFPFVNCLPAVQHGKKMATEKRH